jgi:uncharacterized protein (TIGR03437 family)
MKRTLLFAIIAAFLAVISAGANTLGTVVPIGGQSADLALDEARGVLYVANFTANRIEVVNLSDYSIRTSINVAAQPSSLALSADGRFLVVTNFSNFVAPASQGNGLTVIDLTTSGHQTFALGNPPLGVAFGIDNLALVVTTKEYLLFDPVSGTTTLLDTIANVTAKTLPVPAASLPPDVTTASVAVSGDGLTIYGMGGSTSTFTYKYDVINRQVSPGGVVLSSGVLGPRTVSLNQDASKVMAGWVMVDKRGSFVNYFKNKTNQFSVGTTVFDNQRNRLYAQIPAVIGEAPVFQITDADNLTVLEKFQLSENFTGKSILSSDNNTLYGVSDSGVMIIPVGSLNRVPRLAASVEDVVFRGSFCARGVATQQITITDPGGNRTPFSISPSAAGVSVSPSSGVTPATVTVSADAGAFSSQKGTVAVTLNVSSASAVNIPNPVRVLVNFKDPDQRGTFIDIPGTLSDLIADPQRNRYYVARQDKNQVLVFDGSNQTQIATLKTYNSPTSLAVTFDGRYLLVGHNSSQTAAVFDLETFEAMPYINTSAGGGNEARSIAVSASSILAAAVDYQNKGHVIQLNMSSLDATQLPSLGIFSNDNISTNTVAVGTPNGSSILFAATDGTTMLYDSNANSFAAARKDFTSLTGAYAASNFGTFVVGANLLNASIVPVGKFETASGAPSGFTFVDDAGFRTTSSGPSNPGIIQRLDLTKNATSLIRATRMAEAPLAPPTTMTRTMAVLYSRTSIVNLTTSGVTVLPWAYDESVAPPKLTSLVNAANQSSRVAPGALVSIYGSNLSPVNVATSDIPLPTALGDSCLTVNGLPIPVLFVSPTQINAQLPFQTTGNVTVMLHTPGGVSDNYNLTIQPQAPGVFLVPVDGVSDSVPNVVRMTNQTIVTDSNPVHHGDQLVIYVNGMGQTIPPVDAGVPAPSDPQAVPLIAPRVHLGTTELPVQSYGLAPGQIGVFQIEVSVPKSAATGLSVPLKIDQGSVSTSVGVRVID